MTTATKSKNNDIDWGAIDGSNQEFTDVYPRIQWHHGSRQNQRLGGMVYTGGLFVPADQFPNFSADGWTEDSFISSQNDEIPGFYSPEAYLAVIRVKTFWDDKGSHTHAICCVKGMDGIFSLQLGGISKAQAFLQLFNAHRNQIVAVANRNRPEGVNALEPFALWCVIKPDAHSQQVSKKDGSKGSEVTRPILYTPSEITLDYVRALWVGTDNYKRFAEIFKETSGWQQQVPKSVAPENGIDTLDDGLLKQIVDLAGVKDYDLRQLALTVTNGETSTIELLKVAEGKQALELLQAY